MEKHLKHSRIQYFNKFTFDDTISITFEGRLYSKKKKFFYNIYCILSLGIVYLLARWFPKLHAWFITYSCDLIKATHILAINSYNQIEFLQVEKIKLKWSVGEFFKMEQLPEKTMTAATGTSNDDIDSLNKTEINSFKYRYNKFYLNPRSNLYCLSSEFVELITENEPENIILGLSGEDADKRLTFFGDNNTFLKKKSVTELLKDEIFHPFNVFQFFSIIIWFYEDYYWYAVAILIMTIISSITTIVETRMNLDKLQNTSSTCSIKVLRDGKWMVLNSSQLVPFDVILLNNSLRIMPCDAVLLNGDAIIDESMLTGESNLVMKHSANLLDIKDIFSKSANIESKQILFSGTSILKTRSRHNKPPIAVVFKTGFLTVRGNLIQSIMFPRPNHFKFYRDSMLFIGIMGIVAVLVFGISLVNLILLGMSTILILKRALDLITVILPPALPATMKVGTVFSLKRLQSIGIFCTSPPRINVASNIGCVCFDKTGTITEESLDIVCIVPVNHTIMTFVESIDFDLLKRNHQIMLNLMACCHSLKKIDGQLFGDKLEEKMFSFTSWDLDEYMDLDQNYVPTIIKPKPICGLPDNSEFGIIREFEFELVLRRMSVIARSLGENELYLFTKGSPESIVNICDPATVPASFDSTLNNYTLKGYRVIACAYKTLTDSNWTIVQKSSRDFFEAGLTFLGFIVFENKLKLETKPSIEALHEAGIDTIMATGDNLLTAISTARACDIVNTQQIVLVPRISGENDNVSWCEYETFKEHNLNGKDVRLAVSGDVFEKLINGKRSDLSEVFLKKCVIYARMSPQQKQFLMEFYQKSNISIAFCGDGANDCGALKAANVGISLSNAEASIAAPFTAKFDSIRCVLEIIKEGRASLVTSFCSFEFMSLYSMVQFTSLTFLYSFGSALSDGQVSIISFHF